MEEKELVTERGSALPPKITKENIDPLRGSRKGVVLSWLRGVLYTLLSSLLIAIAAFSLIAPNSFTIGGVSGIAILINAKTGIPQWSILLGFNLPLVICAYFFVKKRFAVLTTLNILLQSFFLLLLEELPFDFTIPFQDNGEKIFAALAAGICIGVAIALAFKVGGSTGGADILAVIIQKKCAATSIAWMLFIINCVVIASSVFVFKGETLPLTLLPIMMSAFEAYIESKTNESMTSGFQSAIEFRIITSKPEEMSKALMRELSRGVTSLPATGMYTKAEYSMLLCVVSRRQVATLRRIMKSVDPDSFAVMSKVTQVLGLGFHAGEV